MSILEKLNDQFEKQYGKNENQDLIGDYRKGNPLDGMELSVDEDSPVYAEQMNRARWLAEHPAKMGYRKRFIGCWLSFLFVSFVLTFVLNSPLVLGVVGLLIMTPFVNGVFNQRSHAIDRSLNATASVLFGYLAVAGLVNTNKPFDLFTEGFGHIGGIFSHIFSSPYQYLMFSFLLVAVMIFAVKLVYPVINRMYCNVPVPAVIVSYDRIRLYGKVKYSAVYQYVYQNKKYLKISPSYQNDEAGVVGACGDIIINPDQPKDAILPEKSTKFEYIVGAVLMGIFAVLLLIFLLTII